MEERSIFRTDGIEHLDDSMIEVIKDYMKDNKKEHSIIDICNKNELAIFYCGEDKISDMWNYDGVAIMIYNSFEEFSRLNDIDDKIKSLDDIHIVHRKYIRKHNNGYVSRIIC